MTTTSDPSLTPPPIPRQRNWWRLVVVVAVLVFILAVVLVISVPAIVATSGQREWETTRHELTAKGEKLDLAELLPPLMPDDRNFFADPLWAELMEKTTTDKYGVVRHEFIVPRDRQRLRVLERAIPRAEQAEIKKRYPALAEVDLSGSSRDSEMARALLSKAWGQAKGHDKPWCDALAALTLEQIQPAQATLARVAELVRQRPVGRFPADYENGMFADLPHVEVVFNLNQVFALRARAEIQLGQGAAAMQDALTIIRLSRTFGDDPNLYTYRVRLAGLNQASNVFWRGALTHAWSAAEVTSFGDAIKNEDIWPGEVRAMRGERAEFNALLDKLKDGRLDFYSMMDMLGQGEHLQRNAGANFLFRIYFLIAGPSDQAYNNRYVQKIIDALQDGTWRDQRTKPFADVPRDSSPGFWLKHAMTFIYSQSLAGSMKYAAFAQDKIVQTRIACALESFYLAHLEYPKALTNLVPDYLAALPMDIVTSQPMHYERTAPGTFRLWSEGWNGKDDHGVSAKTGHLQEGDWVWGETR